MTTSPWALNQISRLLPLDEESLNQILEYNSSLPEQKSVEHLQELLGTSPQALEFISSFNARRKSAAHPVPEQASSVDTTQTVPRAPRNHRNKKPPLNNLPPPRRPDDYGNVSGGYQKNKDGGEYTPAGSRQNQNKNDTLISNPVSLSKAPAAQQLPRATLDPSLPNIVARTASPSKSTQASRAASPTSHAVSDPSSRNASPRRSHNKSTSKQKVTIPGGTPMHGSSSTFSDLESALRTLEMSTNPKLQYSEADNKARACSCMGSLHPLLTAAPNCTSCGKIICVKEGLAPCTFCGAALLTGAQVQDMVRALRDERGREKMAANNAAQAQKGGKSGVAPAPATGAISDAALTKAMAHKDKLLNFQASNAKRTQIVDEAAAFETPDSGVSQWSSAEERAQQLKNQQKILKEMEWNAKPEWEKRRMVVSVDIVGGKVVRRMQDVGRPELDEGKVNTFREDEQESDKALEKKEGGAFAKNPLLGKLVKPVWRNGALEGASRSNGKEAENKREGRNPWRRVQDDADDNEEIILNGGMYGGREAERIFAEEPACG